MKNIPPVGTDVSKFVIELGFHKRGNSWPNRWVSSCKIDYVLADKTVLSEEAKTLLSLRYLKCIVILVHCGQSTPYAGVDQRIGYRSSTPESCLRFVNQVSEEWMMSKYLGQSLMRTIDGGNPDGISDMPVDDAFDKPKQAVFLDSMRQTLIRFLPRNHIGEVEEPFFWVKRSHLT